MNAERAKAAIALREEARALCVAGSRPEAQETARRALDLAEQEWGTDHENLIPFLELMGFASRHEDFRAIDENPVPYLLRALTIGERVYPSNHPKLADLLGQAGMSLRFAGRTKEAHATLLRAAQAHEANGNTSALSFVVGALATMMLESDAVAALPYCERIVRLEADYSPNSITNFVALLQLGRCLLALNRREAALEFLERARDMLARASGGTEHRWMSEVQALITEALRV